MGDKMFLDEKTNELDQHKVATYFNGAFEILRCKKVKYEQWKEYYTNFVKLIVKNPRLPYFNYRMFGEDALMVASVMFFYDEEIKEYKELIKKLPELISLTHTPPKASFGPTKR